MAREQSIRLPARLVGVVRTDPAAAPAIPPPASPPCPAPPDPMVERQAERARIEKVLGELVQATAAIQQQARLTLEQVQAAAVDLAVAVASHFLMVKVRAGDFPFDRYVHEALERLVPRQPVTVVLHPEDLEMLQERMERWDFGSGQDLRWRADPALGRGDCHVETSDRSVLFDLGKRLEYLREVLKQSSHG